MCRIPLLDKISNFVTLSIFISCMLCTAFSIDSDFKLKHLRKYFTRGLIGQIFVRSLTECCKECGHNNDCFSVSFHKRDGQCFLLDRCPNIDCDNGFGGNKWVTYCKESGGLPKDCRALLFMGKKCSTEYDLDIGSGIIKTAICDMTTDNGGWTVIQRRYDGSVDFNRGWEEYKNGFGSTSSEFWLGNDAIHLMTSTNPSSLYIEMMDFNNVTKYAHYTHFRIDSEEQFFILNIGNYSGTAGDCVDYYDGSPGGTGGAFSQNGMKFSTKDRDNDLHPAVDCADTLKAGWWFSQCTASNLNGLYPAIYCKTFGNDNRPLQFVQMMVRRNG